MTRAETLVRKDKPAAQSQVQAIKGVNVSEDLTRKAEPVLTKH
jgi:hypothetical protein